MGQFHRHGINDLKSRTWISSIREEVRGIKKEEKKKLPKSLEPCSCQTAVEKEKLKKRLGIKEYNKEEKMKRNVKDPTVFGP